MITAKITGMRLQPLKGFRDFLPEEALKRAWLKEQISRICESWGYDPMETPTLEPLELFSGQVGEDEKLFYKFKDPGGRAVALRYDQTVPTCRIVGGNFQNMPMPFKRYQIQSAYRAENTQKGRYREFLQVDADIFGVESALADAEVIALSLDIYRRLGFPKALVKINDRKLLRDLPYKAIVAIDKLDKVGRDGVVEEMIKSGIDKKATNEYLEKVLNLRPNETIQTILNYLKTQGFDPDWYEFNPTIARSFSYSTGPIWEIKIPGFNGSVLGGERFDKLVEKISGEKIPGTGFGLGFDRTLEAAQELGLVPNFKTKTQILVTVFSLELLKNSSIVALQLRSKGINAELYADPNAKLDKQLRYADSKGIPYVVIIGPDEAKEEKITVKDLRSQIQDRMDLEHLIEVVQKLK